MGIKRRKRIGKPLLTATAATTITFASCYMGPVGNLMAAPNITELCVDVTPDHAELMIYPTYSTWDFNPDGGIGGFQINDEECVETHGGFGVVTAKAQGFVDVKIDYNLNEHERNDVAIDMVPINSSDAGTSNTGTSDAGTNEPSDGGE